MSKKWLATTLAVGSLAAVAIAATSGDAVWRAAYPHLPRRVQAAPYVLRARLRVDSTPVALPTAALGPSLPAGTVLAAPSERDGSSTPGAPLDAAVGGSSRAPTTGAVAAGVTPAPAEGSTAAAGSSTAPPEGAVARPADFFADLPPKVELAAPAHQYQTWNNCGPATLAMALSALGASVTQSQAATTLKPDPDDKNVSPDELAAYAASLGFDARVRVGGSVDELRALLALGLPVIVETWFIPTPGDEMGHYLVLHGYDTSDGGSFRAADSYEGPGRTLPFVEFDELWRVFNRTYVALYPPDRSHEVAAVWGPSAGDDAMLARAEADARAEVAARGDAFAWFNLGSSLASRGDPEAASAFDHARERSLPWRMMWYQFGPFEAYAAVQRWGDVRALASANLANAANLEESHYWMGRAAEAAGDTGGARASYETARRLNPNYAPAAEALARLAP